MIVKSVEKRYKAKIAILCGESFNANFTQVCFFLTFLPALLLPSVQTTMKANRQRQAIR